MEILLRQAGRLLEVEPGEDAQRIARVLFRFASRVRSDRLERAA